MYACEALAHLRDCVEELCQSGILQPFISYDTDAVNMYGSIEWDSTRQQQGEMVSVLPSGREYSNNKGAELLRNLDSAISSARTDQLKIGKHWAL